MVDCELQVNFTEVLGGNLAPKLVFALRKEFLNLGEMAFRL